MTTNGVPVKTSFVRKIPANNPLAPTSIPQSQSVSQSPIQLPRGTKISLHNGQLLVSSGLHQLDNIFGGGIAVGSIVLIEEDSYNNTSYFSSLLKYFIAEGLAVDHEIALVSPNSIDFNRVSKYLPTNVTLQELQATSQEELKKEADKEKPSLNIAWQYEKYLTNPNSTSSAFHQSGSLSKPSASSAFCHSYDLSSPAKEQDLHGKKIHSLILNQFEEKNTNIFQTVYTTIAKIVEGNFKSDIANKSASRNILRIALQSIGSPTWIADGQKSSEDGLLTFLHGLRGLLRSSLCVCMITVPSHLLSKSMVSKIQHMSDTVIAFSPFKGIVADAGMDSFQGHLQIKKLPRLNSLVCHVPETFNYIFKLGRRKLHIQIPHLGPEITREPKGAKKKEGHTSNTFAKVGELLCIPGGLDKKSVLDF